ncbi:cytochrome c oxidase subunit 6A2, mitochondrial-like [Prorops nasuta]|uniref:cytochrome c oxidase subunit 6A2, mitochondrial-like n=1 Tax=Prorops nasuta TaxID=863751 RepID=UPI0034CEB43C
MASKLGHRLFLRNFSSKAAEPGKDKGPNTVVLWRSIFLFVGCPSILLGMYNAYQIEKVHKERPPFIPYEYLRIRNKPYPWGDGQHTFFHNPHVNPLPDGYEEH